MALRYDLGLDEMKLLYRDGDRTPEEYLEYLALEARMQMAMREVRLFGRSQDTTAEINRVVYELNRIALEKFSKSFNDICQIHSKFRLRPEDITYGQLAGNNPTGMIGELEVYSAMEYVSGGRFIMGADDGGEDERPQHEVEIDGFYLGIYPVTNRQYQYFVSDAGIDPPSHWPGRQAPAGKEDHPVTNVTFVEAYQYCIWLRSNTGLPFRLPTEAEWERAARGEEEWAYPWGPQFELGKSNTSEARIRGTTPVTQYPSGASPFGIMDMVGNIWEWTSSLFRPYPYDPADGREDINVYPRVAYYDSEQEVYLFYAPLPEIPVKGDTRITMRGGSWGGDRRYARCSSRIWSSAGNWGEYGGFRLAGTATSLPGCGGTMRGFWRERS